MRVILAFLIILAAIIPFFLCGGFATNLLLQRCAYATQCYDHETCHKGLCVNACDNKVCHMGATCEAKHHSATCVCLYGYELDENLICRKLCRNNATCAHSETCENHKCRDVCDYNKCKNDEVCKTNNDHSYSCICKPGRVRSLNGKSCVKIGLQSPDCLSDTDCHTTEKCENGECVNACITNDSMCNGVGEGCSVNHHVLLCLCLPQFNRDPVTHQCVPVP